MAGSAPTPSQSADPMPSIGELMLATVPMARALGIESADGTVTTEMTVTWTLRPPR